MLNPSNEILYLQYSYEEDLKRLEAILFNVQGLLKTCASGSELSYLNQHVQRMLHAVYQQKQWCAQM